MSGPSQRPEPGTGERLLVFAPEGIGEVLAGDDLAGLVLAACTAAPDGPLRSGDVVVITSKVVSKAEGRAITAADREASITEQTVRTVARRGPTRIVENPQGLVQAAAGVDASNVAPGTVLLLPVDADASAARLREALQARTGLSLGVIVSDTAGRAWRHGQIDLAIGSAGLRSSLDYAGRLDAWGNELAVTQMAVADEIASAADLVKSKLLGRPVAVLRGLGGLLSEQGEPARALSRTGPGDMFARGTREAVLHAALSAQGRETDYERLVLLDGEELSAGLRAGTSGEVADFLDRLLRAAAHRPPPTT